MGFCLCVELEDKNAVSLVSTSIICPDEDINMVIIPLTLWVWMKISLSRCFPMLAEVCTIYLYEVSLFLDFFFPLVLSNFKNKYIHVLPRSWLQMKADINDVLDQEDEWNFTYAEWRKTRKLKWWSFDRSDSTMSMPKRRDPVLSSLMKSSMAHDPFTDFFTGPSQIVVVSQVGC